MKKQGIYIKYNQKVTAILSRLVLVLLFLGVSYTAKANDKKTYLLNTTPISGVTTNYEAKQLHGIIGKTAEKRIDNPSDNFFTVEVPTTVKETDIIWLTYELKGLSSFTGVSRQINDHLAMGGFVATKSSDWSLQREAISASSLKKGTNTIQFGLPNSADYGYEVKNLQIIVEASVVKETIAITTLTNIEGADKTYVRGFITDKSLHKGILSIEGKTIVTTSGAFEVLVDRFESTTLTITDKKGTIITQEISTESATTQKADYVHKITTASQAAFFNFSQLEKGIFTTDNVILEVEKGALLSENKQISVTPLRSIDRIALDFGMTNITKGEGYRFLPHGTHFKEEGALVKMKYDRTKIPSGYTEDDIRTYYFDTKTGHWIALERKDINKEEQYIISETTHFTDMINGVIKTPESPESTGYSPTTISGIKAADPSAKVNLIQPPSANGTGSANVSYPIEVPPGRKGMQPNLAIQYNSDGGNGWLGNGWDLSVPSISVETRWGVPLYDSQIETETYNLQGSMLVGENNGTTFVAHKGDEVSREADRQFYKRIGGGFERIIRKGNSPDDYYWVVTDKSGTQYSYGGTNGVDSNAVLRDPSTGDIAQWLLVEIRDTNGNFVSYKHEATSTTVYGSLEAQNIYCTEVTYTGYNNTEGDYKVTFDRIEGESNRKDRRTSANYGFLVLNSDDLLKRIEVTYNGSAVRSYELDYTVGAFFKTLLYKIRQYDASGNLFNEHSLEYYDDVNSAGNYTPFKASEDWVTIDTESEEEITGGLLNPTAGTRLFSDKIPVLGGGETVSYGGSVYVGVGAISGTKSLGAGASLGYSGSTSKGIISMVDINGDGLVDKVVDDGGSLYYLPNMAIASEDGTVEFGKRTPITGVSDFSKTVSSSFNGGGKAHAASITVGGDISSGRTKTSVYFADVNSDGLIDIVKDGGVYFNRIVEDSDGNLIPTFTNTSAGTPSPIQGGGTVEVGDTMVDEDEQQEQIDNSPLHDVVRIWRAPFTGRVSVVAPVNLIAPADGFDASEYDLADGVHVAIEYEGTELWSAMIPKDNFDVQVPGISNFTVTKGEYIYFRVQSGEEETSNGNFDKVLWDPVISYAEETDYEDYNGNSVYNYQASASILETTGQAVVVANTVSSAKIEGFFEKPVTTDDVQIQIVNETTGAILHEETFAHDLVVSKSLNFENLPFSTDVDNLSMYSFKIISNTQVDWQAIKWEPSLISTITSEVEVEEGVFETFTVDDTSKGMPSKNALVNNVFVGAPYTVTNATTAAIEVIPNLRFSTSAEEGINTNTTVYAAVKQNSVLVQKYELAFSAIGGSYELIGYDTPITIENFTEGDEFWVEYSIPNENIAAMVTANSTAIYEKRPLTDDDGNVIGYQNITIDPTIAAAAIYTNDSENRFGSLYKNWGQFGYNAMGGRASQPINENLLVFTENEEEIDPKTEVLAVMSLNTENGRYEGYDAETYIDNEIISASRVGLKNVILTNPLANLNDIDYGSDSGGTGAFGITKVVKNYSETGMIGALGATLSGSTGDTTTETDFRDMNGDGYPDIITKNTIQYTNSRGGFSGNTTPISGIHASSNNSDSYGLGGSPIRSKSPNSSGDSGSKKSESGGKSNDQAKANVSGSVGISFNYDQTESTYQDINGDGLADRITGNQVAINTGYGFLTPVTLTNNFSLVTKGKSDSQNAGLGFDIAGSSFSGGFGVNRGDNTTEFSLMDINSDGLTDKVTKRDNGIYVSFNTGLGFDEEETLWGTDVEDINRSSSTGESVNAAFTIPITIPVVSIQISINPSVNIGQAANRNLTMLNDVDGDGFLDYLTSDSHDEMQVRRSTIKNTNRLKSVQNPLGGSFEIAYERSKATYNHPSGKWVMESVVMKDGIVDDGPDMKTVFDYQEGKFDRHERTFLGFGKVLTNSINTNSGGVTSTEVYRTAEQEFDVSTYYRQGNLLVSELRDADDNVYTKNENEYYDYSLLPNGDTYSRINSLAIESGIGYYPMQYTKMSSFEGGSSEVVLQESVYEYGDYGEVENYKYTDKGDLKSSNFNSFNYRTSISYSDNLSDYIIALPSEVKVASSSGTVLRKTAANYDNNGNITQVSTTLNTANETAVVDLEYDNYGNITKRTMPENHDGDRMFYEYDYESDLHTYVEKIEDAFGYHTRFESYDYRFGQLLESEDINGFFINYEIDDVGRITKITGPKEHEAGVDYTIKFSYFPDAVFNASGEITQPAYALTEHYDPQHVGDNLETVTFMDGMARAIQVKKEGVISEVSTDGGAPTDQAVYIISGRVKYDAYGRAVESYYPTTEEIGARGVFNTGFDNITPKKSIYDVQDRATTITLPDGAITTMEYTVDTGLNALKTTFIDAENHQKSSFTNGSSLVLRVEEEEDINTTYEYDAINQITRVNDVNGNQIESKYDIAGRRTSITHPDAGETNLTYDAASNMVSKETANLLEEEKKIIYTYDFNRLHEIIYPNQTQNNVTYYYGNRNASHNRVGRLTAQEDATGAQEFFYGNLGEITKIRRTVIIPNNAVATFETQWKFDTWNRLEEMIYPDEEKITYSYNTGGLLDQVTGEKTFTYNYISKIGYDKFEQRNYLKYCNGAETIYSYEPERRRLSNLVVFTGEGFTGGGNVAKFMDNDYSYDQVNNVLSVTNTAPISAEEDAMGGQIAHNYSYDSLYRLTDANGSYVGADNKVASYTLSMTYDNLHNITSKSQHITQEGVTFDGQLSAGYDLTYNYGANPHQIETLEDTNYRTEGDDERANKEVEQAYNYDLNGNLIYIAKNIPEKEDTTQNERKLLWDEENRLMALSDNGYVSLYTYDAGGERVTKQASRGGAAFVNAKDAGGTTQTNNYTAYVNPYFVLSSGGQYTKHILVNGQRIVSKLGDVASFGEDPRRIGYAGDTEGIDIGYETKYGTAQQVIRNNYAALEVEYYGEDNNDFQGGVGFCCDDVAARSSADDEEDDGGITDNEDPELYQYYYHADHLGSASYITNLDGEIAQHVEYVPFGEVFLEEKNNKWNSPYLFNGKERDEETGLSYYGARYYDAKVSQWLSVDPLVLYDPVKESEHYIDGEHNRGVFNSGNLASYAYTYQNPLKYTDPNGKQNTAIALESVISQVASSVPPVGPLKLVRVLGTSNVSALLPQVVVSSGRSGVLSGIGFWSTTVSVGISETATRSDILTSTLTRRKKNKGFGSYSITFSNGKKYHGKGNFERAVKSALFRAAIGTIIEGETVAPVGISWSSSHSEKDSFKDEHTRMQKDKTKDYPQGYKNPKNYNVKQSPGYLLKKADGEKTE